LEGGEVSRDENARIPLEDRFSLKKPLLVVATDLIIINAISLSLPPSPILVALLLLLASLL
jgi:hypothetical protein